MMYRQLSNSLFFILLALIFLLHSDRYLNRYTTPYDFAYYADHYLHSQYVEGEGAKYIVSDYDLYSFAGHYYFTGGEVSRVNFENPPLGKYLIGLSIYLFNNQVVIYISYAIVYLIVTYKFGLLIFKRREIALLAPILLVIDPYFLHGVSMPLLDFPMATFFLTGFYLFFKAKSVNGYTISAALFGLSIATKFFPFFAVLLLFMAWYQWAYRRRDLKVFLLTVPIIFLVYTATFFEFFIHQHKNLYDFLHYQWWVIRWRMGNPIVVGNILNGILFGKSKIWWTLDGGYVYWTEEWSLLMPLIVISAFVSILILRKSRYYAIIYGYFSLFLAYTIFVTEGGLKYLMPLYPFFVLYSGATLIWLREKVIGHILHSLRIGLETFQSGSRIRLK